MALQFQELNDLIVKIHSADAAQIATLQQTLRSRSDALGRQTIGVLRVGQRVGWVGKHGESRTGTVERIKNVWVSCVADKRPGQLLGERWNVRASALTPLEAGK